MKSKIFKIAILCFVVVLFNSFKAKSAIEIRKKSELLYITHENVSNGFTIEDIQKLNYVKAHLKDIRFQSLYNDLIKKADKALKEGNYSVMQKTQVAESGDKHDYVSFGPYWWPDPKKADGLPWIRRDGEINPLTRGNATDYDAKNNAFYNIKQLSLAYFFSEQKQYAKKAITQLNCWFIDEETKMNPNLNFAQAVPGENTGRGFGIIELADLTSIITAIEILELHNELDVKTSKSLRTWFSNYVNWLQTSEPGIFEKNTKNNHGVFYDVQVASILIFLKRNDEARQVLENVKTNRIALQIEPDGKQPHELARTKSLSYSIMNLRGFTLLAILGKKVEVDLWSFESKSGGSIKKAYEFLKPFAKNEKEWLYQQINSQEKVEKSLCELFLMAGSYFNISEYCLIGNENKSSSLFYVCQ